MVGIVPSGSKPQPSALEREVGRILLAALTRRELTPNALTVPMGLSRSQVSAMLNGWKHWDLDQLDAACAFLELDPTHVLDEADHATRDRPRPASYRGSNVVPLRQTAAGDVELDEGIDKAAKRPRLTTPGEYENDDTGDGL